MSDRETPQTDTVWADKSRNILTHSHNLELQRDEAREERDTALAQLDVLEQSIAELSHPNMRMLVANIEDERTANKALSKTLETCLQYADSSAAAVTAELKAERIARKALTKALMICIRYADSSADTEQAHAALALAAKLP
jgi:predicted DNA-binding ribbon-helix-helix protein